MKRLTLSCQFCHKDVTYALFLLHRNKYHAAAYKAEVAKYPHDPARHAGK